MLSLNVTNLVSDVRQFCSYNKNIIFRVLYQSSCWWQFNLTCCTKKYSRGRLQATLSWGDQSGPQSREFLKHMLNTCIRLFINIVHLVVDLNIRGWRMKRLMLLDPVACAMRGFFVISSEYPIVKVKFKEDSNIEVHNSIIHIEFRLCKMFRNPWSLCDTYHQV